MFPRVHDYSQSQAEGVSGGCHHIIFNAFILNFPHDYFYKKRFTLQKTFASCHFQRGENSAKENKFILDFSPQCYFFQKRRHYNFPDFCLLFFPSTTKNSTFIKLYFFNSTISKMKLVSDLLRDDFILFHLFFDMKNLERFSFSQREIKGIKAVKKFFLHNHFFFLSRKKKTCTA